VNYLKCEGRKLMVLSRYGFVKCKLFGILPIYMAAMGKKTNQFYFRSCVYLLI
jgi:hypothetical protein